MKILQCVTLVTTDGTSGGVIRVAVTQSQALRDAGHDVTLIGGWREHDGVAPAEFEGVPAVLSKCWPPFPGAGQRGLLSLRIVRELWREIGKCDVAHVHACRDFITVAAMAIGRLRGVPYVVQTHGMVTARSSRGLALFDALLFRRLLRGARSWLVLTDDEARDLPGVLKAPRLEVERVRNAIRVPPEAWAPPKHERPRLLFCARLHPRKRPEQLVEAAALLRERGVSVDVTFIGPDEGSLEVVTKVATRLHISKSICVLGAVEHDRVLDFMLDCDVYVLPSVDEPFPIALLEALAAGVPSVCTTGCGLANELRRYGAAIVADPAPQSLASAIAEALAPDRTEVLSRRSRETVQRHFSTGALLAHLVDIYSRARLAQV